MSDRGRHATIELAVVGAAHIHLPDAVDAIAGQRGVRVAWVWDPDGQRAAEWAARFGAEPVADLADARAMQAALVYGEPSWREAVMDDLATRGVPAFVEKPLALSPESAQRVADRLVAPFQTGFFLRYCPALARAGQIIASGRLGAVRRVHARFVHDGLAAGWFDGALAWMGQPGEGGGGFFDLAIHCVDLAGWLLGEPLAVESARLSGAHLGSARLRWSGGAVDVEAGWEAAAPEIACAVDGTRGSLEVRGGRLAGHGVDDVDFDGPPPSARAAIEPWLDALLGRPARLVPAQDAVRAVALTAALRAAASS